MSNRSNVVYSVPVPNLLLSLFAPMGEQVETADNGMKVFDTGQFDSLRSVAHFVLLSDSFTVVPIKVLSAVQSTQKVFCVEVRNRV